MIVELSETSTNAECDFINARVRSSFKVSNSAASLRMSHSSGPNQMTEPWCHHKTSLGMPEIVVIDVFL